MPTKSTRSSKKGRRTEPSTAKPDSVPEKKHRSAAKGTKKELDPTAERFIRDVVIRGEAAKPSADGTLPPGVTHRIVEDKEESLPTIEREGFSLY